MTHISTKQTVIAMNIPMPTRLWHILGLLCDHHDRRGGSQSVAMKFGNGREKTGGCIATKGY
jgi:hypothetical protein